MIEDLFSVPLYSEQLNLNTHILSKYCVEMKKVVSSSNMSNIGGWQSPPLQGEHKPLDTLSISILNGARDYQGTFQYKNPLRINNMWVNINGYKDYNLEHHHSNAVISGVYYVKVPKNSGDLVFSHPATLGLQYDWGENNLKEFNRYNAATWIIPPIENRMFLFPGWLRHSVRPNLNKDQERISISFNLTR